MTMRIDEHIVMEKPMTVRRGKLVKDAVWTRRSILKAVWELRTRIMDEQQVDIFQVYEMTDCIEVHIEGDFETLYVGDKKERRRKRMKFGKQRRAR